MVEEKGKVVKVGDNGGPDKDLGSWNNISASRWKNQKGYSWYIRATFGNGGRKGFTVLRHEISSLVQAVNAIKSDIADVSVDLDLESQPGD